MDSTLLRTGRNTHVKIVVVAIVAVIAFVTVGINAKIGRDDKANGPTVIRAGDPATYAGQAAQAVR